jgi:hypothetical protein
MVDVLGAVSSKTVIKFPCGFNTSKGMWYLQGCDIIYDGNGKKEGTQEESYWITRLTKV